MEIGEDRFAKGAGDEHLGAASTIGLGTDDPGAHPVAAPVNAAEELSVAGRPSAESDDLVGFHVPDGGTPRNGRKRGTLATPLGSVSVSGRSAAMASR